MLIQDNGLQTGGISGGCIEGNALKKANLAFLGKEAVEVIYDTSNENEEDIGVSQAEEIAVSIVAEILAVMRNRPRVLLKLSEDPIYSR